MERLDLNPHGLSAPSFDPMEFARMRADTINNTPGTLTDYDCPKCMNRGFMAHLREDGSLFTRDCGCKQTRRCIREMERSGLKNSIREMTFDAFTVHAPWQETLKNAVREYARKGTGWLMLGGQSGCGKTHLCTAVCRQRLLDGYEVRYMPWRDKIAQLKAVTLESDRRAELMDPYKNAQILYIDDLYKTGRGADGNDLPSSADISLTFEILNHRYINRLDTIISTEKTPQQLVSIDEATGSRIIELAGQYVFSISKDPAKNYRMRSVVNL